MTQPPNILWICTDQQRFDTIAAWGNSQIRTPHMDRLVDEGVSFRNAFCQSTVCAPSRASFLTGRYPRTTGCRQNGQKIPASERLISRILADADYTCGLAGKQHLASCADGRVEERNDDGYSVFHWSHHPQPDWPENAYTQWLASHDQRWEQLYNGSETPYVKVGIPAKYHQTTWCAEMAIDFIQAHRERPWMFSFNCFDPHHPFDPPAEYLDRYRPQDMPRPTFRPGELDNKPDYQQLDHEWAHNEPGYFHVAAMTERDRQQVTAAYYAMVELIDDQIGRMLKALEESGQRESTIVILMSDHGEMLGDHGLYLKGPHFYEAAVRVPLVLNWPGQFAEGHAVTGLVELVDLVPTLLDACHMPSRLHCSTSLGLQGRTLIGHCRAQTDAEYHRDDVFCEYYNAWTHPRSYGSMLRTEDWKFAIYHGTDQGELYNLTADPDEFENLWNKPAAASDKHRLMKRAFDRSVFTMDPLPPRLGPF